MTKIRIDPGSRRSGAEGTDEESDPTIGDEDADGMDRIEMRKPAAAKPTGKDKRRNLPS